jgi:Plavaka transposase
VGEALGLSYQNVTQLDALIDTLPGRPPFKCETLTIYGQEYSLHYRDIVPCIRGLIGNPEFADHLVFAPKHHYIDAERKIRVIDEMYTGDWWWFVQVCFNFVCASLDKV